jgi:hypothetical protein
LTEIRRQLKKGELRTNTVLLSLAQETENLAEVQERLGKLKRLTPEKAQESARATAGALKALASNIRTRALAHLGEPAVKVSKRDADRELKRMSQKTEKAT